MKYIKIRFRLSSPSEEPFDSYGWDTLWNKKAQIIGGEAVEPGNIVDFQPVTVRPDGKCLILSTQRNIKAIKAMVEKRQASLAPGETLDIADAVTKRPADEWPSEPKSVDEDAMDPGEVAEEAVAISPKKRRKVIDADLNPDVE